MTYILERKDKLLQEADRLEKELFKKQIAILQDYYRKSEVQNRVREAFAHLWQKWDRKKPAAGLGIHYLFTSIHNRTYEHRLVLFGEEFYLDEEAVEMDWKPELFFSLLEEDVEMILKQIRGKFPRLCRYEEELIRNHCSEYYEAAVCRLCQDMLPKILESETFGNLKKTEDFFVLFGTYRGEGEIIA
ncbi:MAG: hypothetical protein PUI46_05250 [Lachnospiraceae bacterium]|nr:hypothetical protein [Lachnospiraceae bacterium]MDY5700365.1 hypothetical protein [Lachnospiraceae bacterium]